MDPAASLSGTMTVSNMNFTERDSLLQRYTYLIIECERLKTRMTSTLASYSSYSPSSGYYSSSTLSPLSSYKSKSPSPPISTPQSRRQSTSGSVPSHPDVQRSYTSEPTTPDEESDQLALLRVQQQIKGVLTGLLNCKDVKSDQATRSWVQQRLMEAEHDMRSGKRRRRSGCDAAGVGVVPGVQPLMSRRNVT